MPGSAVELTDTVKDLFKETATQLTGTERRQSMGQVVHALGPSGQAEAEWELGWNRGTIRKGLYELEHGANQDAFKHW
ncbi:MAG: hypothetical protein KME20_04845 [Kaiparowitsia implicata GSE-PSE-MK54-09C]|jgi:DNA-binding protein Fis|nr:hypothetical protein [Kaiparowitsia implicata GSE-PSE-MK54-09C]